MTHDDLIAAVRAHASSKASLRPTATPQAVAEAEAKLGLSLPTLVRRLYLEVADGGFGPTYGLLPLRARMEREGTLVETYLDFTAPKWNDFWPVNLLPLFNWGATIWSCIDITTPDSVIVTHESKGAAITDYTLATWLEVWIADVNLWEKIYGEEEDIVMYNPFTGKPTPTKKGGRVLGRPYQR